MAASRPDWQSENAQGQEALPLLGATIFSLASVGLDRMGVEFVLGGFFYLQVLSLGLTAGNIFTFRSLADPRSVEGQIKYSAWFRYRNSGAVAFGAAVILAAAFALTGALAFAGATIFAAAAVIGAFRRARQAARQQAPPIQ